MLPIALLAAVLAQPPLPAQVMADITPERCKGTVERLASFGTRHTLSDTTSDTRGIGAARRWIKSELDEAAKASGGRMQVSFEEFEAPPGPRVPRPVRLVNVVAVLPGTMAEAAGRFYYVVGHFDSRNGDGMDAAGDAPGANDDASGTAVVMEIARVLAARRLDSTVVFLCTCGEEQGLLGAKYHADQAKTRGERILGVLSNDIVGDPWGREHPLAKGQVPETKPPAPGGTVPRTAGDWSIDDRHSVRVFSEGIPRNPPAEKMAQIRNLAAEYDSPSRQLARFVAEVAGWERTALRPRMVFRLDRFLRGGDHSAFSDNGFPAVRFTAPVEDYSRQHQNVTERPRLSGGTLNYGDTVEFVDAGYVADVARLNTAALVHLANAPSPPGRVRALTADLANNATLRWVKSPEPDVAGYEVVWRDTTSPTWDHAKDVGMATEATIELSKDDWFFGVRAYDKEGYRSPVVFAVAARE